MQHSYPNNKINKKAVNDPEQYRKLAPRKPQNLLPRPNHWVSVHGITPVLPMRLIPTPRTWRSNPQKQFSSLSDPKATVNTPNFILIPSPPGTPKAICLSRRTRGSRFVREDFPFGKNFWDSVEILPENEYGSGSWDPEALEVPPGFYITGETNWRSLLSYAYEDNRGIFSYSLSEGFILTVIQRVGPNLYRKQKNVYFESRSYEVLDPIIFYLKEFAQKTEVYFKTSIYWFAINQHPARISKKYRYCDERKFLIPAKTFKNVCLVLPIGKELLSIHSPGIRKALHEAGVTHFSLSHSSLNTCELSDVMPRYHFQNKKSFCEKKVLSYICSFGIYDKPNLCIVGRRQLTSPVKFGWFCSRIKNLNTFLYKRSLLTKIFRFQNPKSIPKAFCQTPNDIKAIGGASRKENSLLLLNSQACFFKIKTTPASRSLGMRFFSSQNKPWSFAGFVARLNARLTNKIKVFRSKFKVQLEHSWGCLNFFWEKCFFSPKIFDFWFWLIFYMFLQVVVVSCGFFWIHRVLSAWPLGHVTKNALLRLTEESPGVQTFLNWLGPWGPVCTYFLLFMFFQFFAEVPRWGFFWVLRTISLSIAAGCISYHGTYFIFLLRPGIRRYLFERGLRVQNFISNCNCFWLTCLKTIKVFYSNVRKTKNAKTPLPSLLISASVLETEGPFFEPYEGCIKYLSLEDCKTEIWKLFVPKVPKDYYVVSEINWKNAIKAKQTTRGSALYDSFFSGLVWRTVIKNGNTTKRATQTIFFTEENLWVLIKLEAYLKKIYDRPDFDLCTRLYWISANQYRGQVFKARHTDDIKQTLPYARDKNVYLVLPVGHDFKKICQNEILKAMNEHGAAEVALAYCPQQDFDLLEIGTCRAYTGVGIQYLINTAAPKHKTRLCVVGRSSAGP